MRCNLVLALCATFVCLASTAQGEEAAAAADRITGPDSELMVTATLTFGTYGPPRSAKAIVCDKIDATLSICGLAHDAEGKVDFSMRMEVRNAAGESVLKSPWQRETFAQGATIYSRSVFMRASDRLDADKTGIYRWRHEVEDHVSGKKTSREDLIELFVPSGLGLVGLRCGHHGKPDGFNDSAGTVFHAGELMYVHGGIVNFAVDDGRGKLSYRVDVLDIEGKPTDWPAVESNGEHALSRYAEPQPLGFQCQLNALRPGKYILRVHASDLIGGTSTTEYLPLLVTETPDWTLDATQLAKLKEQAGGQNKSR